MMRRREVLLAGGIARVVPAGDRAPPEEVTSNLTKLREFKAWLGSLGFRSAFTTEENLKTAVVAALGGWKERQGVATAKPDADPSRYFASLRE